MSTGNCLALRVAIRLSLPFLSGMYAHVCPNLEANGGDVQLGVLFLSIQFSHSLIYSQRADPLIQTERPQTKHKTGWHLSCQPWGFRKQSEPTNFAVPHQDQSVAA